MQKLGLEVEDRNFAKVPLTKAELTRIVDAVESIPALVNTRHAVAKENGWKDKAPSKRALIAAALEEPNVIRRPVLIYGKRCIIGNDVEAIEALARRK